MNNKSNTKYNLSTLDHVKKHTLDHINKHDGVLTNTFLCAGRNNLVELPGFLSRTLNNF